MGGNSRSRSWAVRSRPALNALDAYIARLDRGTRARGRTYFQRGLVLAECAKSDGAVEATVEGSDIYTVALLYTKGVWSSACTCPLGTDCKHVVAAAMAWIKTDGLDFDQDEDFDPDVEFAGQGDTANDGFRPIEFTPPVFSSTPPLQAKSTQPNFRAKWAPILAEKLGRPLNDQEGRMLGQLSALFHETCHGFMCVSALALRQHGFADAIPPSAPSWGPALPDWMPQDRPPSDPWALWQYLAYSLELQGKEIPEVFRPMTDTAQVHASVDARLTRQQLEVWRSALSAGAGAKGKTTATALQQEGVTGLRTRFSSDGQLWVEVRAGANKPWKRPTSRAADALTRIKSIDVEALPPAEAALAIVLALTHRSDSYGSTFRERLPEATVEAVLNCAAARPSVLMPDERPCTFEPTPLVAEARVSERVRDRLEVRLVRPDGAIAEGARLIAATPEPLYWYDGRIWRGPPQLPRVPLPIAAFGDPTLTARFRAVGLRLPTNFEVRRRVVKLQPRLRLWLIEPPESYEPVLRVQLFARATDPAFEQEWRGRGGWVWLDGAAPPPRGPDDPILEIDAGNADAVGARFGDLRLYWDDFEKTWARPLSKAFPDELAAWRASLPTDVIVEASPELAGFFDGPLRAHVDFSAVAADASHDWFDLTVALRVEDTRLTEDEIALLLKARGKWVRLPERGWRRLEVAAGTNDAPAAAALDRLGLTAEDVWESGNPAVHRLHALQLAGEAETLETRDAALANALRARVSSLQAFAPPPIPAGLTATLRPYQKEGFDFLAHLAERGFGGVLADDMGLGKTVQALAWLLHLVGNTRGGTRKFRALVVCPKSVTYGWLTETERFAPKLPAVAFAPAVAEKPAEKVNAAVLVANYTQLRLHAEWFQSREWDAVILDEGQFIKNPGSQVAETARSLKAKRRVVLTGTPVENRLTDLWSLFAFAQPGLLGTQAAFRRQYDEKDPAALARVHRRVRHFLLRRTKAQAAPDLPPRTEDEIFVELEGEQRKLYDAELKRARQQLLRIETDRALDKVRFNVLASLLRLRQICCHPALIDPAHAALPSAKLDALIERLEELKEEGHQVLVFSQFVEMLELIRTRLRDAGIGHLLLTGATENRADLMTQFQKDSSQTVFLLSLKAAGFGLNLTAASYAVLFDPWWNPAVEAQAIDRTHRIGQTKPVIAYRFLARDTVEEKIRLLQQEKAALAAAVVKEESLASVLDLESLRRILA